MVVIGVKKLLFPKISFRSLEAIEGFIELLFFEIRPESVSEMVFAVFALVEEKA